MTQAPLPKPPRVPSSRCSCGSTDQWKEVLGGREVCMKCGNERAA